ncbi:MAG: cell division protein FtsA [Gemmatimonadetes bacterium]|nr:cell division protein FtsA [Gemmatimonadota bacterium]
MTRSSSTPRFRSGQAPLRGGVVAGLDIGSTKTCVVIGVATAEPGRPATLKVLGVGQARTGGMRREVVTDIEETTESVRQALKEAELMAGVKPVRVFAGIAGEHIQSGTSTGVVAVAREEIAAADVERVQAVARAVLVPADRELLHVLPQEYAVDHQVGIRDPAGMAGTRLEAEVFIITASATAGQNLRKAASRAGYVLEALVHEPLATAHAVLTEDEREIGVALVDLGGGTTEVAIFRDGKTRHLATLPWGGAVVTNDLVKGLSIPFAEAERVKEKHGAAFAQLVDPRDLIDIPGPGPGARRPVARELVAHIIEQRLDEILGLVAREIESAGESSKLGAGVVLTGGGASLPGIVEIAQQVFGQHVRVGVPGDGLRGLVDSVRRPKFATATGLALYAAQRTLANGGGARFAHGTVGRVVAWLKEFF